MPDMRESVADYLEGLAGNIRWRRESIETAIYLLREKSDVWEAELLADRAADEDDDALYEDDDEEPETCADCLRPIPVGLENDCIDCGKALCTGCFLRNGSCLDCEEKAQADEAWEDEDSPI